MPGDDEGTIVVTHYDSADAWRPSAPLLLHVQAGSSAARRDLGLQRDDSGQQISERNPQFGELTAVYWAWRNLPRRGFIGFAHYRRYFVLDPAVATSLYVPHSAAAQRPGLVAQVGDASALRGWLRDHDVILPPPRGFARATLAEQYAQCHAGEDFQCLLELLRERHPHAHGAEQRFATLHSLHCCNMFIAGWDFADAYLGWLFPLIFELEQRLPRRAGFQRRNIAFLAERLMEYYLLWRAADVPLRVLERPLLYLDEKSAAKSRIGY
jgi:hypothetical protein